MQNNDALLILQERIKKRRKELKLSIREMEKRTGICRTTFQRYESGTMKRLPMEYLGVIADALKVSQDYLLNRNSENDTAILELKMPTNCSECILSYTYLNEYEDITYCYVLNVPDAEIPDEGKRPDCPLKLK